MGITINNPFGNGLYQLSMVIWGMVDYCYTHMIINRMYSPEKLLHDEITTKGGSRWLQVAPPSCVQGAGQNQQIR